MKKIISIILSIVTIVSICIIQVCAEETKPDWKVYVDVTNDMDYCSLTYKLGFYDYTDNQIRYIARRWDEKDVGETKYTIYDSNGYSDVNSKVGSYAFELDLTHKYTPVSLTISVGQDTGSDGIGNGEDYRVDRSIYMYIYFEVNGENEYILGDVISDSTDIIECYGMCCGSNARDDGSVFFHWDTAINWVTGKYNNFNCYISGDCDEGFKHLVPVWYETSHNYVTKSISKNPSCITEGYEWDICTRCGGLEKKTLRALGHDLRPDLDGSVMATCCSDGYFLAKCSRCNYSEKSIITKDENNHNYDIEVTLDEPTCYLIEGNWKHCANCDRWFSKYGTAIDEIDGIEEDFAPHTIDNPTVLYEASCRECRIITGYCSVCKKEVVEFVKGSAGHKLYTYWENGVVANCTTSSRRITKCSVCGEITNIEYVGGYHSWQTISTEGVNSCTTIKTVNRKCTVCGKEETLKYGNYGHKTSTYKTTAATCTTNGTKYNKCNTCGEYLTETIPALGHDYVETIIEPTSTTIGYSIKTCVRCRESIVTTIPVSTDEKDTDTITPPTTEPETEETTTTTETNTTVKCNYILRLIEFIKKLFEKIENIFKMIKK